MLKKLLALILALTMLSMMFVACSENLWDLDLDLDGTTEATETESTSEAESESTTESPQPEETEPPAAEKLYVTKDGTTEYKVILSSNLAESTRNTVLIQLRLFKNNYGVSFTTETDTDSTPSATAKEILVGSTNRQESADATKLLRDGEYAVTHNEESGRIALVGTDSSQTLAAFNYFFSEYLVENNLRIEAGHEYYHLADYALFSATLNGVDLREYRIVIPKNPDLLTHYTSTNLADTIEQQMGVRLKVVYDSTIKTDYEILIGKTNRAESTLSSTIPSGKYLLMQKGTKLVIQGKDIQVCAGAGALLKDYMGGEGTNRTVSLDAIPKTEEFKKFEFPSTYRNAILMIGDGMGHNHINLALDNGLDSFSANYLPAIGTAVTRSQDVIDGTNYFTDSAASGTALATGYKTYNGRIGLNKNGTSVQNVRELADAYGAKTAIISTDPITGATPAAFLCHNSSRNNTTQLQAEIDTLIREKKIEYCRGNVGDDLTVATREALLTISGSDAPFFMMVEEAYTDKGGHSNSASQVTAAVTRFNKAISYVIAFVYCHPDTALIITADHETGGIVRDSMQANVYKFTSSTHTNVNVPVFALGPGTEVFHGERTENINIAKFIAVAYGKKNFGDRFFSS